MQEELDRKRAVIRALYVREDFQAISRAPAFANRQRFDRVEWSFLSLVEIQTMQILAEAGSVLILHSVREEWKQFARQIFLSEIREAVEGGKTTLLGSLQRPLDITKLVTLRRHVRVEAANGKPATLAPGILPRNK